MTRRFAPIDAEDNDRISGRIWLLSVSSSDSQPPDSPWGSQSFVLRLQPNVQRLPLVPVADPQHHQAVNHTVPLPFLHSLSRVLGKVLGRLQTGRISWRDVPE